MYRRRLAAVVLAIVFLITASTAYASYYPTPSLAGRYNSRQYWEQLKQMGILRYILGEFTVNEGTFPVTCYPLDTTEYYVTSNFGYRYIPGYDEHEGVDLDAVEIPVFATHAGTVKVADNNNDGAEGRWVMIESSNGWRTKYMHLQEVDVTLGASVQAGDQIGLSGASGYGYDYYENYGYHLHFAVERLSGGQWIWYDPIAFLTDSTQYSNVYPDGCYIPTVRQGSSNTWVRLLQDCLNRYHGFSLTVDGAFGTNTYNAVCQFQRSQGLDVDGVVGPMTWRALLAGVQ